MARPEDNGRLMILGISSVALAAALVMPLQAQELIRVPDEMDLDSAVTSVADGGVIEITRDIGAPVDGFRVHNIGKSITIRGAGTGPVTLDGGGVTDILRSQNTSLAEAGYVVFRNLRFANGYNSGGGAAGLTLFTMRASFIDCEFAGNRNVGDSVGGAVYLAVDATAFFLRCLFEGNSAHYGGAGVAARGDSTVWVHECAFIDNRANLPGHHPNSSGAGMNIGNSIVRVVNTLFQGNQAGGFGGGLAVIGTWLEPYSIPRAHAIVANCTFIDNTAVRDPSVGGSSPTEGGAVNVEDQAIMEIYSSRFITNSAKIGGGVNNYRAHLEMRNCVLLGNAATDTAYPSANGGAISIKSPDGVNDGTNNRPNAHLTLLDSYIQGRYGNVTTAGQTGGGLFAGGDGARMDGDPTVPDMGTLEDNQATVVVRNTVFADCDVIKPYPGSGCGGGVTVGTTNLVIEDSLFIGCDAFGEGEWASGGALCVFNRSAATVTGTTFVANTSERVGAAVFVQGSEVQMDGCTVAENEVSPGVAEAEHQSYGAGIFTGPDTLRDVGPAGVFSNCLISRNVGMQVFDDDRNEGPFNQVRYDGNTFYSTHFGDRVYKCSLTPSYNADGLNDLVVTRTGGPDFDKSRVANSQPGAVPVVGELLAVPPVILTTLPPGDPWLASPAYLGYAWTGAGATLDGAPLVGNVGFGATEEGVHHLVVGSETYSATVSVAATPRVTLTLVPAHVPPGGTSTLTWTTPSGDFLDCAVDQGVTVNSAPAGSVEVTAVLDKTFTLFTVTEQGGAVAEATLIVGELPENIFADGFESGDTSAWGSAAP